jgi:hypothetical protein
MPTVEWVKSHYAWQWVGNRARRRARSKSIGESELFGSAALSREALDGKDDNDAAQKSGEHAGNGVHLSEGDDQGLSKTVATAGPE